mgnify:CR=1 FL=1
MPLERLVEELTEAFNKASESSEGAEHQKTIEGYPYAGVTEVDLEKSTGKVYYEAGVSPEAAQFAVSSSWPELMHGLKVEINGVDKASEDYLEAFVSSGEVDNVVDINPHNWLTFEEIGELGDLIPEGAVGEYVGGNNDIQLELTTGATARVSSSLLDTQGPFRPPGMDTYTRVDKGLTERGIDYKGFSEATFHVSKEQIKNLRDAYEESGNEIPEALRGKDSFQDAVPDLQEPTFDHGGLGM